jgi:hypothetical protein
MKEEWPCGKLLDNYLIPSQGTGNTTLLSHGERKAQLKSQIYLLDLRSLITMLSFQK